MAFDWTQLREPAPETLVPAREAAHAAAQWATKAARANLPAKEDDSHSALLWDAKSQALVTQPLKVEMRRGIRVGLDVAKLELVFFQGENEARGASGEWLDGKLTAAGLAPASAVKLPYDVPGSSLKKDPGLPALARWFAAASEALEAVRAKHAAMKPSPAWLWPHHFDLAATFPVADGKSIGVGVSMGDHHYAQPYAYISAYPAPKDPRADALPPGGHWHTKDFFGAVASAEELLAQPDPRKALMAVIDAAFDAGKRWLAAPGM